MSAAPGAGNTEKEVDDADAFSAVETALKSMRPSQSAVADEYAIVLTPAEPGSIPPKVWRSSYVIYL